MSPTIIFKKIAPLPTHRFFFIPYTSAWPLYPNSLRNLSCESPCRSTLRRTWLSPDCISPLPAGRLCYARNAKPWGSGASRYQGLGMATITCYIMRYAIQYYLDRPDILSVYTVRMEADKQLYPLLLSNGNKVAEGDLPEGRHFAVWEGFYCRSHPICSFVLP